MAIDGEIIDITLTMEEVHVKKQLYYIAKPPSWTTGSQLATT
jgi:hypothetical protein